VSNGHHRLAVSLTLSPQSLEISREGLSPSDHVLSKDEFFQQKSLDLMKTQFSSLIQVTSDEKNATQVGISSLGHSTSPANLARFIDGGVQPRIGDQLLGTLKTRDIAYFGDQSGG
jgi:hypothetical protein